MVVQKFLEGEKYVTISFVPFFISKIRSGLQEIIHNHDDANTELSISLAREMLASLNESFGSGEPGTVVNEHKTLGHMRRQKGLQPAHFISAFLDPRFKSLKGIPTIEHASIVDMVREECLTRMQLARAAAAATKECESGPARELSAQSIRAKKRRTDELDDFLVDLADSTTE